MEMTRRAMGVTRRAMEVTRRACYRLFNEMKRECNSRGGERDELVGLRSRVRNFHPLYKKG